MDRRKLQKQLINVYENERKESKEFLFPEEDFVRHRRPSKIDESTEAEDDNEHFEVNFIHHSAI
jgi:hypothetical protein